MKKYTCTSCGQFLLAKAFSKDNANKSRDGLRFNCKKCQSKKDRASYARRKEALMEKLEVIPETVPESKLPEPETASEPESPSSGTYEYTNGSTLTIVDLGYEAVRFNILEPGEDLDEESGVLMKRDEFLSCIERLQKTICFAGRG